MAVAAQRGDPMSGVAVIEPVSETGDGARSGRLSDASTPKGR